MARLEGTSAIVTGAAQGIGATYARALAAEGARVSVCDLDPPDTVVQAIQAAGGEAIGRICDVSNAEAVSALVWSSVPNRAGSCAERCWSGRTGLSRSATGVRRKAMLRLPARSFPAGFSMS
jgi:hypothetical protein